MRRFLSFALFALLAAVPVAVRAQSSSTALTSELSGLVTDLRKFLASNPASGNLPSTFHTAFDKRIAQAVADIRASDFGKNERHAQLEWKHDCLPSQMVAILSVRQCTGALQSVLVALQSAPQLQNIEPGVYVNFPILYFR